MKKTTLKPYYQALNAWQILAKIKNQLKTSNPKANLTDLNKRMGTLEVDLIKHPEKFSKEPNPEALKFDKKSEAFQSFAKTIIREEKRKLTNEKNKSN
jgi:hypothetical protein